ncbi:MAG: transporter [Alphaproteobacteria bacterium]|jgi:MFS family permease|nr:transporter [Alphaproteobacteria bacterium]
MIELNQNRVGIQPSNYDIAARRLMGDAAFASIVGTLNSGVVLVAFAVYLGASPTVIGILAALPFLTQFLQVPAVLMLERIRSRRLFAVTFLLIARLALPVIAILEFIPDRRLALALLVVAETLHCAFNAMAGCAWNSWMRDLVPEDRLGSFFGRRAVYATAAGIAGTVMAAIALEYARPLKGGTGLVFVFLYGVGFLASLISTWELSRVPDVPAEPRPPEQGLWRMLVKPLKDRNFRRLIQFMASWQFAVNLAVPFFTVFLIGQLGYTAGFVLVLSVVSQIAHVAVARYWGGLSDRFSNKSVLTVTAPLFILCIAAMAFAGESGMPALTATYLMVLHALMGMATAGVTLASGAISLKLAPQGSAHVYVATNALVTAAAAGTAPILAGIGAEVLRVRELSFQILWHSPGGKSDIVTLGFGGWQLLFLISALMGLYALHRLSAVEEHGAIPRKEMLQHVLDQARRNVRNASPVAGLRAAVAFPAGALIQARRSKPVD